MGALKLAAVLDSGSKAPAPAEVAVSDMERRWPGDDSVGFG